jgi:hypothetical protein
MDAPLPVACYPHGWDSVGFYMPGHSVRIYSTDERTRLFTDLHDQPGTLLVAKTGEDFTALLKEMPGWMEFVPQGRKGLWVVGQIRQRRVLPDSTYAVR